LKTLLTFILILFVIQLAWAQPPHIHWKKRKTVPIIDLQLFHSTQVVNLPTVETIRKGEFEFEISHRFIPPLDQKGAFLGIDGPVNMRIALAYGITDRLLINLGRSNREDNLDLRLKYKLFWFRHKTFPFSIAVRAGTAWTTQVTGGHRSNSRNFQYYGQIIFNTLLFKKLGMGIVPSYLYNSHIYCQEIQTTTTLGSYMQYYLNTIWSLYIEMNNTMNGYRHSNDAVSLGFEIETGGHFFKIFLTNSQMLNPSQFLAGADLGYFASGSTKNWRIGFNITRILKF